MLIKKLGKDVLYNYRSSGLGSKFTNEEGGPLMRVKDTNSEAYMR